MNEIYTTIVGNMASAPMRRRTADGTELASFRLASNVRRFDRETGEWVTSGTSYVTVTAWRRLGINVAATFVKGDPVVVYGRLSVREYAAKDGGTRIDVDIDANAIGPDLSRCTAAVSRPRPNAGDPVSDAAQDVPDPRDEDASVAELDGEDETSEVSDDPWPSVAEPAAVG
ncbi:MAG: single-stranded DNA-binding protein [Pseudonocardia sp.]|uniref:single-stranded DNA-binding protein n=1 Tax=Pseudonocardia sp. TaxID=60912 RepID=UPI000B219779|nr:single-stranded DNA-binding protein [Pseudonocardia sp.]MBN9111117.1 single-stranded DNA-binding protein [Pseudonocardia sp.]